MFLVGVASMREVRLASPCVSHKSYVAVAADAGLENSVPTLRPEREGGDLRSPVSATSVCHAVAGRRDATKRHDLVLLISAFKVL
jgi:hypothetical protein